MALSKMGTYNSVWNSDALLSKPTVVPTFARTEWDAVQSRSFGAWAAPVQTAVPSNFDRPAPTDGETNLAPDLTEESALAVPVEPSDAEEASAQTTVSEEALAQLRDEAFRAGVAEGRSQHLAEIHTERAQERELIQRLGMELHSISQDPQRFFEPLKRLSLHLAEQLVRAELKLSGQAIHGLVQSCIAQLEHPVPPVQVSLNPDDLKQLQAMGEAVTAHLQLESDANLRPGSVRVRVQDSVVQDLIENRLEPLARRLLPEPEAWMQNSSLVRDRAEPLPESTPKRDWNRQVIDVQDTDVKASPPEDGEPL
jgi:flagellar biosynthesis/type III secretory pathway protein FliH